MKYNGATYIYRKDGQGNIISLLDSNGRIVVKYAYDAWGNYAAEALDYYDGKVQFKNVDSDKAFNADYEKYKQLANINPFRYRGYYYDTETELYFLKTRYYDPEVGRFISPDSIEYLNPDSINGLNLYAYCSNNPVMEDREFVSGFIRKKIPSIYKTDKTDRILFVELVEFDVCPYLLGQRQIDSEQYSYILNEYERYLSQTDISTFDEYAKEHFRSMVKLIDLFKKKYYTM